MQSLTELLQRQPGVEIIQNGGPGSVSGALLRGANRGQTLVLVDGLRVGSSSAGSTTFEAIPLDQIDRVEILRGPASSLYGADAIGGVVQVFTKQPQGAGFTPNVVGGLRHLQHGVGLRRLFREQRPAARCRCRRAAGAATASTRSSIRTTSATTTTATAMRRRTSRPAPTGPGRRDRSSAVQYLGNRLDNQYDGGPGFDDRTITTLQAWSVVSRNRINDAWTSQLTAGEGSDDSESQTAFGTFPFKTTQQQYLWQNDFTLPLGNLGVILERRLEHLATDAGFATTQRNTNSATGVYQLRYGDFALQANLRRDDSDQYGGKTTGGIALGYKLSPAWRVTAGASTGFKAPSFNDLYYPGFSNPDLVPETSKNYEAGVYWTASAGDARWEARAVGFHNAVDNLIVFQCDADFNCLPQNVEQRDA